MAPTESNNAPAAAAILTAGVIADVEEDDDAEVEETPESGEPLAEELSAQTVLSETADTSPAPWSPEPQPAPEPAAAPPVLEQEPAAQPVVEHGGARHFELSGQVTDRPADPEPSPAAPSAPAGNLPDSGSPDQ